jgi:hypothetical protein
MTRETFIKNIDNITDEDIICAFDSLMSLYCLYNCVGVYENIKITKSETELASFNIEFGNSESAKKVYDKCNGAHVKIYDTKYNVTCTCDNNSVYIKLL